MDHDPDEERSPLLRRTKNHRVFHQSSHPSYPPTRVRFPHRLTIISVVATHHPIHHCLSWKGIRPPHKVDRGKTPINTIHPEMFSEMISQRVLLLIRTTPKGGSCQPDESQAWNEGRENKKKRPAATTEAEEKYLIKGLNIFNVFFN